MDVEYRLLVGADKKSASQKVVEYRDEYKQLLQTYEVTKAKAERLALQNGSAARNKLISANQRLDESTATLEKSRIILAETEAIGNGIIVDLESQKESLKAANSNVKETKQYTVDAKVILTTMGRRAVIHNTIMAFIILILFGVICVIGYYGFVEKKKK
jgi:vesicle transport through interaction with t-SNAREs 1